MNAKFKKNVATKSSNLAKHQIFYFIRNWKSIHSREIASVILRMIVDTEIFNNKMVRAMPMLISIKEAYYEYCYGIFLNKLSKATIYIKRA